MAPPTDPKAPRVVPQAGSAPAAGHIEQSEAPPPQRTTAPPPRPPAIQRPPSPPSKSASPPPIGPPKEAGGLFADLPDLPKMAGQSPKRNLTLVGMFQGGQSAHPGRSRWLLPGLGGVMLAAIVGSVVYREALVKVLVAQKPVIAAPPLAPVAPVLTASQKAAIALAAGSEAYASRDYGRAVASFEQAINLDPSLADAHRSLGIVHADLHDEAEAIAHYQKYIEMVPHGRDSARVKKIIDDYNAAHAPPPAPVAPPPLPPVKMKRHRGHLHRR